MCCLDIEYKQFVGNSTKNLHTACSLFEVAFHGFGKKGVMVVGLCFIVAMKPSIVLSSGIMSTSIYKSLDDKDHDNDGNDATDSAYKDEDGDDEVVEFTPAGHPGLQTKEEKHHQIPGYREPEPSNSRVPPCACSWRLQALTSP